MAFQDMIRPDAQSRLRRLAETLFGEFVAWRERTETRRTFGRMSDRELSDIGLSRGELDLPRADHLRNA